LECHDDEQDEAIIQFCPKNTQVIKVNWFLKLKSEFFKIGKALAYSTGLGGEGAPRGIPRCPCRTRPAGLQVLRWLAQRLGYSSIGDLLTTHLRPLLHHWMCAGPSFKQRASPSSPTTATFNGRLWEEIAISLPTK